MNKKRAFSVGSLLVLAAVLLVMSACALAATATGAKDVNTSMIVSVCCALAIFIAIAIIFSQTRNN